MPLRSDRLLIVARGAWRRAEKPTTHREQEGAQPDSHAATRYRRVSEENPPRREGASLGHSLFRLQQLRVDPDVACDVALQ